GFERVVTPRPVRSASLGADALSRGRREDVDPVRVGSQLDLDTLLRRATSVDPSDDLLLLVAAAQQAVQEGVGAELLDDRHLDRDAVLLRADDAQRLRADSDGSRGVAAQLGADRGLDRNGVAADVDPGLGDL